MHHYQNISYLVDAFNQKQLTVLAVLFSSANIIQLNSIIHKLCNKTFMIKGFHQMGRLYKYHWVITTPNFKKKKKNTKAPNDH